jgi:hypothetical protein
MTKNSIKKGPKKVNRVNLGQLVKPATQVMKSR